jgi:hypothetical protein
VRLYATYGLIAGWLLGIALGFLIFNNGFYLLIGAVAGLILGGVLGSGEDTRAKHERRLI